MLYRDVTGKLWSFTTAGWVPVVAHLEGGVVGDRMLRLSRAGSPSVISACR